MELCLTISTVAFLQHISLWLFCPVIFENSLGRVHGDSSVMNQSNEAWTHTLLAGLRESGEKTKGTELGLEGQIGFQLAIN